MDAYWVLIASLGMPGQAWLHSPKIISSICWFNGYVPACKNQVYTSNSLKKFKNLIGREHFCIWPCPSKITWAICSFNKYETGRTKSTFTSIRFWDIKVLKASLGIPRHAWPHPLKLTQSIYNFNKYKAACTKSTLYLL